MDLPTMPPRPTTRSSERVNHSLIYSLTGRGQLPVLAANSGGPLETIDDGVTGWLRPDVPREWAAVVRLVLFQLEPAELREMGRKGRERVATEFSRQRMAERLESEFCRIPARSKGIRAGWPPAIIILLLVGALAVLALGIGVGLRRINW